MKNKETILLESFYDKVVEGAKKKIKSKEEFTNPYAVEASIEKKTGKHFSEKKKKKIKKEIEASAKHAGKKITSDKVK